MTQAGGFETGSDFVAARVSFDIDSNGISTLRELSEELNRYRTATEAASRTTSDFTKYIQQMTQLANQASEAQTNLVNQLQRMADSQQSLMTGQGTQVSRGAPQGYVNPFSGMGGGNGAGTANRPPTIGDASSYLGGMAQQDPRQYFNMQSGWGNVRAGDLPAASPSDNDLIKHAQRHQARDKAQSDQAASSRIADPFNSAQQRISGMTSGAASLLSELGPGGNGMGMASLVQQGLMSLSGSMRKSAAAAGGVKDGSAPMGTADDAAGAAGNVAGMLGGLKSFAGTGLGAASLGVGAAVGGMALFQQGGEMVQGYRSMGQMRGGGLQEGLGYEMAIRAQPLSAQVLTPQGWMKMGDLSPGDQVISGEGTSTTVLKVYDHGVRDVYEVQFDDGSTTRCTLDHLWAVYTQNNDLRVMRFEDMIGGKRKNEYGLTRKCGRPRYRVPLPEPINFEKKVFPVDPYTLGILLGDGSHSQHYVGLTCFEDEVYDMALPPGVNLKKVNNKKGGTYYFQGQGQGAPNPMVNAMKEIGLMGVACRDKFIPEPYLFGSVEQRLALLQGLMDTDGYISASDGRAFFTNSSPRLIDGVRSLVLSLGGKAKVFTFPEKVSMIKGKEVSTKISYKMEIRLPSALGAPVRLPRKVDVYRAAHHKVRATSTRQIVSARQVTSESCRCIYIDHPGHLYVTDEYIVTHNSMALSPFITTDQARQIVSQGLSSGYTGKEFDTVTQFMAPQPMDEPVLTPQGWRTMKDITAGDYVIGSDGTPKLVLGVQDKGVLECFRVMFRDGSYARSSEDHLWVTSKSNKGFIARPLKEIRKKIHYTNPRTGIQTYVHAVPLVDPVHMARQNLPIDPYLLGLLLGDGDISASLDKGKIRLSCFEDEGYSITTPFGCIPMRNDREYTFPANSGFPNASGKGRPVHPLKHHLHTLGLLGTNHKTKFIPRQYLESSIEDRAALLQGLIDTDGGVYRQTGVNACSVRFFNTNPALINGVAELVRSLGGIAKITWNDKPMPASWLKSGQKITPRSNMGTVSIIRLPEGITPARLARKAGNYAQTINRRRVKYITDVIPDGECEMRCLLIDSADHLYVTRDFTLTHNTNLKDMNIQAAESMKVFKKNVSEGGMSAEGLSGELGALKQASKTGYSSTADLVSSYAGTSGALISAGVSGPSASNAASTAAVMFKDDASLKDIGGAVMQSAASNPTIGAMLMNPQLSGVNLPRGTTPRSAMEALGGDPTAIINIMRFYARQFSSTGSKAVAVDGFQMWLQRTFPGVGDFQDRTKVEKLMTRLLSGENIVGKANKEMEASRAAQVKTRDATASFGSVVGGVAGGLGAMVETGWAGVQDFFGNLFNQEEGFSSGNPSWKRTSKAADEFTLATSDRRSNQLDIIAREHGIGNLEVGTGNSWKQLDPRNVQMVKDLESGKLKIRERGQGPGMTLRETVGGDGGLNPQSSGPNAFSIAPQNVNVGGVLKVTVEDNRQVQVDNEVRLTPTQDAAAEGWNGAQYNNPTPGDRRRQRG